MRALMLLTSCWMRFRLQTRIALLRRLPSMSTTAQSKASIAGREAEDNS